MNHFTRQIVLDTETTGREIDDRIIEIGCFELINRRLTGNNYQQYLNPQRSSDPSALAVHGLKDEFLAQYPVFKEIAHTFLDYIKGAQLIIHNAAFDVAFLDRELQLLGKEFGKITDYCTIFDTLPFARQMHPGQRNSLDALCKRYNVNHSHRNLHGALLDAELLALVYLAMTGGQTHLFAEETATAAVTQQTAKIKLRTINVPLRVINANQSELTEHQARLTTLDKTSNGKCVWLKD